MKLYSTIPILVTADLDRTAAFYHTLGFEIYARYHDYLTMHWRGVELHFQEVKPPHLMPRTVYCRIEGVDEFYDLVKPLGEAHVLSAPTDQFYGIREFSLRDPDGNVLHLGENIPGHAKV